MMTNSLPVCFTTAITLLLFQAVVMFSAPQPLRQERQVEEDVPLGLRIETGLIRLKDLIISLFPYPTEPDHEVNTCTVHWISCLMIINGPKFLQLIQIENIPQFTGILCPLFGHYSRFYTLETYLGNDTKFSNISHITYVTQRLLLSTCEYVSYNWSMQSLFRLIEFCVAIIFQFSIRLKTSVTAILSPLAIHNKVVPTSSVALHSYLNSAGASHH